MICTSEAFSISLRSWPLTYCLTCLHNIAVGCIHCCIWSLLWLYCCFQTHNESICVYKETTGKCKQKIDCAHPTFMCTLDFCLRLMAPYRKLKCSTKGRDQDCGSSEETLILKQQPETHLNMFCICALLHNFCKSKTKICSPLELFTIWCLFVFVLYVIQTQVLIDEYQHHLL